MARFRALPYAKALLSVVQKEDPGGAEKIVDELAALRLLVVILRERWMRDRRGAVVGFLIVHSGPSLIDSFTSVLPAYPG